MLRRNVSGQKWRIFAFNRKTGEPVIGDAANITAKIALDHALPAPIATPTPMEVEAGYYLLTLDQAETDADHLDIYPTSTTADVQVVGSPANIATFAATSADVATVKTAVETLNDVATTDIAAEIAAANLATSVQVDALNNLSISEIDAAISNAGLATSAQISTLSTLTAQDVKTQIDEALRFDTHSELVATPPASTDLASMIRWIYALQTNPRSAANTSETTSQQVLRNRANTSTLATNAVEVDSATFFSQGAWS